jgi:hypothetical protein
MYQYYLHSDRFERSSILGVCMSKDTGVQTWMNFEVRVVPTRSLQSSVVAFLFGGRSRGRGDKCVVRYCQAIGAVGSRVRIRWRAVCGFSLMCNIQVCHYLRKYIIHSLAYLLTLKYTGIFWVAPPTIPWLLQCRWCPNSPLERTQGDAHRLITRLTSHGTWTVLTPDPHVYYCEMVIFREFRNVRDFLCIAK